MKKQDLIRKEFQNIELDVNNFEYNYMTSFTSSETYSNNNDAYIIDIHLHHIIEDMKEEGWYLLACKGELKDYVKGTFLFYRKKVKC